MKNKIFSNSDQIVKALGMISSDITFEKWEPYLPLGTRNVVAIVGRPVVDALTDYANGERDEDGGPNLSAAVGYLRQAVALFTWLKMIPTLGAQHGDAGRAVRLGENEKGLTALQEFKDEENILHLAYEATDALIEELDETQPACWAFSDKYKLRAGLLIQSKEDFDRYYTIGSARLFVSLLPILCEVQAADVAPVLGPKYLRLVLEGAEVETTLLRDTAARALALLTMKKAVERLPVEVLPEGIVQVQQSQPVKSRLKAEQKAREAVAASLGEDGARYLTQLAAAVAELEADGASTDTYTPGPIVHSKGMTF